MDAGVVQHLWKEWAVQILVLASFFLQVFLFVFAGLRRRSSSTTLRVALWLAYLMVDSTATYTLGHLSVSTTSPEHQLVAFWAPFLLLHLGGQDTITAYALEDNRLWLRHLQTLVVQVAGAAYVLYRYLLLVGGSQALVAAAVLMFVVGLVKYGERIWALRCADNDGVSTFIGSYCKQDFLNRPIPDFRQHYYNEGEANFQRFGTEEERVMYGAHRLLGVCMCLFLDRERETSRHNNNAFSVLTYLVGDTRIFKVIEMELSLMYDILYTKARVIHSLYGLCIRLSSLLAMVATVILMFPLIVSKKDGYKKVDVAITCILLCGAFLLEITSGFTAMVSTWTRHYLYTYGSKRGLVLYPVVVFLRRLVMAGSWRGWSGTNTVGQFNLMAQCARELLNSDGIPKPFPSPVKISTHMEGLLLKEISRIARKHNGVTDRMYTLNQNHELPVLDLDVDARIITWHIATHLILYEISERQDGGNCQEMEQEIKTLSYYMMFLLIKHPEMLPGNTRRHVYLDAFYYIQSMSPYSHEDESPTSRGIQVTKNLLDMSRQKYEVENSCKRGAELAVMVLKKGWGTRHLLEEVFRVWVEMLCYTGSHCSRDSHARKLSSGGEFLTVVWLLSGHLADFERTKHEHDKPEDVENGVYGPSSKGV